MNLPPVLADPALNATLPQNARAGTVVGVPAHVLEKKNAGE